MVGRSLFVYGGVRAGLLPLQILGGIQFALTTGRAALLGWLLVLVALPGAGAPLLAARAVRAGERRPSPFLLLILLAVLDGMVLVVASVLGPTPMTPFTRGVAALVVIDLLAASTVRSAARETG